MGFAALSNRLLLSPTGTSFSSMQRSRNTFLGVGWIPLPIMRPAVRPASQLVDDRRCVWCERQHESPEGNACDQTAVECDGTWYSDGLGGLSWTLFFDTANFKGPVGFFIDEYWLRDIAPDVNPLSTLANTGFEHTPSMGMEFNGLPAFITDSFVKTPRMRFPNQRAQEPLVLNIRMYGIALYNKFVGFMQGEADPLDPSLDEDFTALRSPDGGVFVRLEERDRESYAYTTEQANFEITGVERSLPGERPPPMGCGDNDQTVGVFDDQCCSEWRMQACNRVETHFFLNWIDERERGGERVEPPVTRDFAQYFRRVEIPNGEPPRQLEVIAPEEAPDGLRGVTYDETVEFNTYPVHDPADYPCWAGGLEGDHEVTLEDGGGVVYRWYRFIDQPAFASYDLDAPTRARLQAMAERVHREWGIDRTYLTPPSTVPHDLVQVEEALMVRPPEGREWADMVGYVPIPLYTAYPDGRGAENHGCAEDYNGVRHCW